MIAKEYINPVSDVKVVAAEVGEDAPQWRKDLDRDGVSGASVSASEAHCRVFTGWLGVGARGAGRAAGRLDG